MYIVGLNNKLIGAPFFIKRKDLSKESLNQIYSIVDK